MKTEVRQNSDNGLFEVYGDGQLILAFERKREADEFAVRLAKQQRTLWEVVHRDFDGSTDATDQQVAWVFGTWEQLTETLDLGGSKIPPKIERLEYHCTVFEVDFYLPEDGPELRAMMEKPL